MGDLSLHFSRHEFDLPEGKARARGCEPAEYPAAWIESRLMPLVRALEKLRAALGGAKITVISGFRPLTYNRSIGSEDTSQHVQGLAADIEVEGVAPDVVHATALQLYGVGQLELGGLGQYTKFTHIDCRGGALVRWDKRTK